MKKMAEIELQSDQALKDLEAITKKIVLKCNQLDKIMVLQELMHLQSLSAAKQNEITALQKKKLDLNMENLFIECLEQNINDIFKKMDEAFDKKDENAFHEILEDIKNNNITTKYDKIVKEIKKSKGIDEKDESSEKKRKIDAGSSEPNNNNENFEDSNLKKRKLG